MARSVALLVLLGLCVVLLPSLAAAGNPFYIEGNIYCDSCRCGFFTQKAIFIPGAKVRIECRNRETSEIRYSIEGVTDWRGRYRIKVEGDQEDRICEVVLVESGLEGCGTIDPKLNSAEVTLTRNNGAVSDVHQANDLWFVRDTALPGCSELVKKLLEPDT